MRRRAYIPAAPVVLEGRAVPSGGPIHLSGLRFDLTLARVKADFEQYSLSGDLGRLRVQLAGLAKSIPFGRSDGLGVTVNGILGQMQASLASGGATSRPIATAYGEVAAAFGDVVKAHVADGTVIVKPY